MADSNDPPTSSGSIDDSMQVEEKDETVEQEEGEALGKGYKNGLPYFHRELSAQDKELIGDISPKQISKPDLPSESGEITRQTSSSAWNAAQTWEEKDWTDWAKRRLRELLGSMSAAAAAAADDGEAAAALEVTACTIDTGDAHIAVVRGRPRYIWDFAVTLTFEASFGGESGGPKGSIKYQEVGYDCDGDYEAEITYSSGRPNSINHTKLKNMITKNEFKDLFCERVETFKNEFHEKK